MRFFSRHKNIRNVFLIVICLGIFAYLIMLTNNRVETDVDSWLYSGSAMGTAVKKTIYAENVAQSEDTDEMIDNCLEQLENQISVRIEDSEVSMLNRNYATDGLYKLSDNIIDYLNQEMEIFKETQGAFSPCIRPLADLWKIEDGYTLVPNAATIEEVLAYTNAVNLEITESGVIFHNGSMAIDFGAVGKGIACDEVRELLKQTDIQGAVVSVGGSILTYGDKGDGKEWHVGIQDPRAETGQMFAVIDVDADTIISTSGDYEKYFEKDGKRYHHIFDPSTGYPAESGLISVTIICENGLLSDALSTACFVMGLEEGMDYAEEKGVEAVFVTSEKKVYITDGLKKTFRLQSDEYELVK